MKTVAIGLSGGVDSTLTALLLKEQGYHVIGLSMSIYNRDIPNMVLSGKSCYGPTEKQDIRDIQQWAMVNGIESHIIDLSESYKNTILKYFKDSYLSGQTPNPCVMCNTFVKFGLLLQEAQKQGITFDLFATGHYAQIIEQEGKYLLKRGVDEGKDQSYFLYRLTQDQLSRTLFPLGHLTKEKVRQMATERGLKVAAKPDSQDFYAGDYTDLLGVDDRLGDIVLTTGEKIGTHYGFWHYTVGQRKGLGIAYPEPLYVVSLNANQNRVIVGPIAETFVQTCQVRDVVYGALPIEDGMSVQVKYRSTGKLVPATLFQIDGGISIQFDTPQKSITKGQSLVCYQNDIVLCGGIIV